MIIKCEKGKHYYNTVEHSVCPFCVQVEKKINEQKSELNKQEDGRQIFCAWMRGLSV